MYCLILNAHNEKNQVVILRSTFLRSIGNPQGFNISKNFTLPVSKFTISTFSLTMPHLMCVISSTPQINTSIQQNWNLKKKSFSVKSLGCGVYELNYNFLMLPKNVFIINFTCVGTCTTFILHLLLFTL